MHTGPGVLPAEQGLASPGLLLEQDWLWGSEDACAQGNELPPKHAPFSPQRAQSPKPHSGLKCSNSPFSSLDHSPFRTEPPPMLNEGYRRETPSLGVGLASARGQTPALRSRFGNTQHPREGQPGCSQNRFSWPLTRQPRPGPAPRAAANKAAATTRGCRGRAAGPRHQHAQNARLLCAGHRAATRESLPSYVQTFFQWPRWDEFS